MILENIKSEKGFTLVELIVAMSVFILAMTIISSLFVSSVKTQRQAGDLTVLNSDSSLVIERMNREIREGYDFTGGGSSVTFTKLENGTEKTVTYSYDSNNKNINREENPGSGPAPLNSSEVQVENLRFIITQPTSNDPWRITIVIEAGLGDPNISYLSSMQTTVTSRSLPCEVDDSNDCVY